MSGQEALVFPFLFLALFFESFVLVTFLSKPARAARERTSTATDFPSVAVIVPCWNEESTVAGTCASALALDYPADKLSVILVDDGSTDGTPAAMAQFAAHTQVRIIRKENGGKHTALNAGIAATDAEFVGCLDADSFVDPAALREVISAFTSPRVAAVTAAMSVHEPGNVLQHMQAAEYILGITLRHAFASVNGLYVTPGPFSFYRKSIIDELGGFRHAHQTEDMEMALRIQRAGYAIENAPRARVYTKTPDTLRKLVRQRTRWTSGFLRNVLGEYRSLIGRREYGVLGTLVLPAAALAVISGVFLFGFALVQMVGSATAALQMRADVPFSYAFLPHGPFDWFYFPANAFAVFGAVALLISFSLIVIGKRISQTPGEIGRGLVSYAILYGLVAPLWLIRATADVTFGKNRGWRG